jgi:hypothetical protein
MKKEIDREKLIKRLIKFGLYSSITVALLVIIWLIYALKNYPL